MACVRVFAGPNFHCRTSTSGDVLTGNSCSYWSIITAAFIMYCAPLRATSWTLLTSYLSKTPAVQWFQPMGLNRPFLVAQRNSRCINYLLRVIWIERCVRSRAAGNRYLPEGKKRKSWPVVPLAVVLCDRLVWGQRRVKRVELSWGESKLHFRPCYQLSWMPARFSNSTLCVLTLLLC